jgi:hypothetical protein
MTEAVGAIKAAWEQSGRLTAKWGTLESDIGFKNQFFQKYKQKTRSQTLKKI